MNTETADYKPDLPAKNESRKEQPMSKHTPGPWTFDNGMGFIRTDTSPYGEWAVAKVNIVRAEAKANARLIAAAPDLLETVKRLREMCADFGAKTACDIAEAAIFKATGEQA